MLGWIRDRQDGALAGIVAVAGLIPAVADRGHVIQNCAVAVLVAIAVGVRRVRPMTSLLVVLGFGVLVTIGPAFAADTAGFVLADLVLCYSAGSMLSIRPASVGVAVGVAAFWTQDVYLGHRFGEYLVSVVLIVAPWLVGRFVRHERERRQQLKDAEVGEKQALVLAAAADERRRIASDMHDVVARGLATITDQSAYAVARLSDAPMPARAAIRAVNRTARDSVDELAGMLAVLRRDEEPVPEVPVAPLRGLQRGHGWWRHRDWILGLLVALSAIASLIAASPGRRTVDLALVGVLVGCVSQRRRWPVALLAVVGVLAVTTTALRPHPELDSSFLLASGILLLTVGQLPSWHRSGVGLIIGLLAFWTLDALAGHAASEYLASAVTAGGIWLIGFVVGRERRQRQQLSNALANQRRAAQVAAAADERGRIARELHDVVAHGLSAIAVQSDAADAVFDVDPARAIGPMTAVRRLADECATELAQLLAVLTVGPDPTARGHQPAGVELTALLDAQAELGLTVQPDIDFIALAAGGPALQHTVTRIVQEALTNVRRHSQARCSVVVIERVGSNLVLRVGDPGPARCISSSVQGHGTIGIRERVAALGGSVEVGPDGGGWLVFARIPISPRSAPLPVNGLGGQRATEPSQWPTAMPT